MMGGTGETKIGKKHKEILLADLLILLLEVDEEEKTEMETFLEQYPFTALLIWPKIRPGLTKLFRPCFWIREKRMLSWL